MGRSACCEKIGLKKGPWTTEEDKKLLAFIEEHGHGSWRTLPAKAGLRRCGKSCRLRWSNYLRPDIKRGKFSLQEEQTIIQLHALLGNKWSSIVAHLPKRTDNEIKNYWNTHLKKRLTKMGIDPVTHKPNNNALGSPCQLKDAANLSHMAQWEKARLEAEARLVRESKLTISTTPYQSNQLCSPLTCHQVLSRYEMSMASSLAQNTPPCLDVLKAWQRTRTRPNASLLNSFFSSSTTIESPTSTLDFLNDMSNVPNSIEFVQDSLIKAAMFDGVGVSKGDVQNNWKDFANHEIQNQKVIFFANDNLDNIIDDLAKENDLEDVNGIQNRNGEFEENNNYWNNILNLDTLQSVSSVFCKRQDDLDLLG